MHTAEVARRCGCSVQQVRTLEARGVLPAVPRTRAGYRQYDSRHVASVLAYQAMATAVGPVDARLLMAESHRDLIATLALLDSHHARLHQERRALSLARAAVESIRNEPLLAVQPADSMSIGQLAEALDLRTSALRHWEDEGLLVPSRGRHGERIFSPSDVRDARLTHQLRQAGYRIPALRELLPSLREKDGEAQTLLAERERSIDARSQALLEATVALHAAVTGPRDDAHQGV